MSMVNKTEDDSEEKIHKGGIGTIDNGMIKLDGTFWQTDDDLSGYKDGDKVEVVDIINNKAKLA
jgi:membrane protein implicated in regulation of membrane protease activity